jgi:DNA processing protein
MSAHEDGGERGACDACRRRSWLLAELGGPLEYCARDRARLLDTLALADEQLLSALAGRRAAELRERYERFPFPPTGTMRGRRDASGLAREAGLGSTCRHHADYPRALSSAAAPHMLEVAGGATRLSRLASAPAVAILGGAAPSDYGMEMARSLARGLAASGVTVAASFTDGIAVAAHAGALEVGGASVAVMGGGLSVSCPARRRPLYTRVLQRGCAVSELPARCDGRRWGQLASERIAVELASVAVVVEADETVAELAAARRAQALDRLLAAVPGRVTSPLSRGTHALLSEGASLVRGAQDVLELLWRSDAARANADCASHGAGSIAAPDAGAAAPPDAGAAAAPDAGAATVADTGTTLAPGVTGARPTLAPALAATLGRVGAGFDTPDSLARAGEDPWEVLLTLSELELMGLLARGDGGRYVPREPFAGAKAP